MTRVAVEQAMAESEVLAHVFGWKRTTGPDYTRIDIARALLDAALAAGCLLPEMLEPVGWAWGANGDDSGGQTFAWNTVVLRERPEWEPTCVPVFILRGANDAEFGVSYTKDEG